jgi:catechol 2,3-dioxygenase-like lactoylglutathione lyase family enzyme
MDPRISFVTLGVTDLERATRFYVEVLKLPRLPTPEGIVFFEMGKTWLALYPRHELAADAGVPAEGSGFSGFTLAHNVRTREDVDRLLAEIAAGGGRIIKQARVADWGGYSGYFADPDGFLWEVVWNPHFPHV